MAVCLRVSPIADRQPVQGVPQLLYRPKPGGTDSCFSATLKDKRDNSWMDG